MLEGNLQYCTKDGGEDWIVKGVQLLVEVVGKGLEVAGVKFVGGAVGR